MTDGQGRQLVDGGLVANVPTVAARSLGADIVIAVDVNSEGAKFLGPPQSAVGVLFQSMLVVQRTVAAHQWREADLVIAPPVGHIRWDEMTRADEFLAAGEEAARASLERIKKLIAPPPSPLTPAAERLTWVQRWRRWRQPQPAPESSTGQPFRT